MAAPLQNLRGLLLPGNLSLTLTRSAFRARKDDPHNPNWIRVGLSFASTIAIWTLIIKEHNADIAEYERRKAGQGT